MTSRLNDQKSDFCEYALILENTMPLFLKLHTNTTDFILQILLHLDRGEKFVHVQERREINEGGTIN